MRYWHQAQTVLPSRHQDEKIDRPEGRMVDDRRVCQGIVASRSQAEARTNTLELVSTFKTKCRKAEMTSCNALSRLAGSIVPTAYLPAVCSRHAMWLHLSTLRAGQECIANLDDAAAAPVTCSLSIERVVGPLRSAIACTHASNVSSKVASGQAVVSRPSQQWDHTCCSGCFPSASFVG